jgi:hypothetical protein
VGCTAPERAGGSPPAPATGSRVSLPTSASLASLAFGKDGCLRDVKVFGCFLRHAVRQPPSRDSANATLELACGRAFKLR